jgi:hypothetical protein
VAKLIVAGLNLTKTTDVAFTDIGSNQIRRLH